MTKKKQSNKWKGFGGKYRKAKQRIGKSRKEKWENIEKEKVEAFHNEKEYVKRKMTMQENIERKTSKKYGEKVFLHSVKLSYFLWAVLQTQCFLKDAILLHLNTWLSYTNNGFPLFDVKKEITETDVGNKLEGIVFVLYQPWNHIKTSSERKTS